MKKVLVTKKIPEIGIEELKKHFEVTVLEQEGNLDPKVLDEYAQNVDGILTQLSDVIDEDFIRNHPNVKVYANYAVGYNNYDIQAGKKHQVIMTNTPDVLSDTTAELAISLLFAVSRRLFEARGVIDRGEWKTFQPTFLLGQDVSNKKIGVIGAGRIGVAFMKKLKGFDPEFYYYNRKQNKKLEEETGAEYVSLERLLDICDIISLHVPLTEETHHLIGEKALRRMKKNAIIINTSRGPVIQEEALMTALEEGWIWGAGLDVYEREPYVDKRLKDLPNVVLTPHIGSATEKTRDAMSILAAENIIEVLSGRIPKTPIY